MWLTVFGRPAGMSEAGHGVAYVIAVPPLHFCLIIDGSLGTVRYRLSATGNSVRVVLGRIFCRCASPCQLFE